MFSGWTQVLLGSRSVLRLAGEDTLKFLQGLTTRNVMDLAQPGSSPLYTAMLNSKGRQLFDLFLHRESLDHGAVLVDCPAQSSAKLLSLLRKFKLRSSVEIDDASEDFRMVAAWNTSATMQHTQGETALAGKLRADPRLPELGLRGPLPPSSCQQAQTDETQYMEHRYMHGVPEGSAEIPSGSAIPLEYNIDWLNGVSYDKGCYVGQELVARVHFGGLVRKRLYCVQFEQPQRHSGVEDTPVFIAGKESSIGTLRGAQGVHGIAHLRISDVEASFKRGNKLHVKLGTDEVGLTPSSPEWWPKK